MPTLLEQALLTLLPILVVTIGTAIYLNRQKTQALYQRLFGLDEDAADDGFLVRMDDKIDIIDEKMDELNHQRINSLETQVEQIHDRIQDLDERLGVEENENE